MSTTWTFPSFVDQLVTAIDALPVIDAMDPRPTIRATLPSPAEDISDVIVFGYEAVFEKEKVSLGQTTQDEEVSLTCLARAIRYGSGDTVGKAARDRVVAYMEIVDAYLRDNTVNVGTQTLRHDVDRGEHALLSGMVGEDQPAMFAAIVFDIDYRARTDTT